MHFVIGTEKEKEKEEKTEHRADDYVSIAGLGEKPNSAVCTISFLVRSIDVKLYVKMLSLFIITMCMVAFARSLISAVDTTLVSTGSAAGSTFGASVGSSMGNRFGWTAGTYLLQKFGYASWDVVPAPAIAEPSRVGTALGALKDAANLVNAYQFAANIGR